MTEVIKTGDKVRLTNTHDDSIVIEATFVTGNAYSTDVRLGPPPTTQNIFPAVDWTVEKIQPPAIERVRALGIGAVFQAGLGKLKYVKVGENHWYGPFSPDGVPDRDIAAVLDHPLNKLISEGVQL